MADCWVEPPPAEAAGAASAHPIDSSSISVLLVRKCAPCASEDVVELLKSEEYVVTEADSGAKALELLKTTRVDLILTDHEPPASDCCDFIRSVLENPKTQLVPIVVMSSRGDKHVMAKVFHAGAADFLLKPLRRNELRTIWTHVWRRWVGMQLSHSTQGQVSFPNALTGRVPMPRASGDSGASAEKADSSGASAPDQAPESLLNERGMNGDSGEVAGSRPEARQVAGHSCAFGGEANHLVCSNGEDRLEQSSSLKRKGSAFAAYASGPAVSLRRSNGSFTDMDTAALLGGLWQPPRPTPGPSAPPPMWQLQHAASVQQPAAVAAAAVAAAAAAAAAGAPQLSVQSLLARPGLTQQHLSLLASRSQPQLQKAAAALLLPQLPPPLAPPLPNMAMPPFGFATALSGGFLPILPGAGYPAVQQVDAKSSQHHVDPQAAAALLASLPFPCMPPVVSSVAAAVAAVQAAVAAAADRNGATSAFEAQRPPFVGALADGTGRAPTPPGGGHIRIARCSSLDPRPSGASGWHHASGAAGALSGSVGPVSSKEQRAEALARFREKRANRNFAKKIRYQSRKQLAESRPRVRGQFVRVQRDGAGGAAGPATSTAARGADLQRTADDGEEEDEEGDDEEESDEPTEGAGGGAEHAAAAAPLQCAA